MLISLLIYITSSALYLFLGALTPIFALFPVLTNLDFSVGFSYIFGTMFQLNTFLPITEALIFATTGLTFRFAMFSYVMVLYAMSTMNNVRRTFVSFRT